MESSNPHPLDLIQPYFIGTPVVQMGGSRASRLAMVAAFERAAAFEISRETATSESEH